VGDWGSEAWRRCAQILPPTPTASILFQTCGRRLPCQELEQGTPGGATIEWHFDELFPRIGFIVTNMTGWSSNVVHFYNQRGTAEQWIKEGKYAFNWTRLSCHDFRENQARLQLFALAYNLGNFLRRLALPRSVKHWSLTTLREKLIKIGAKVVRHSGYAIFQMAEVAVPRELFAAILERIQRFGVPPPLVPRE
jgi:hypothetical protein